MILDYCTEGKVKIDMREYTHKILDEAGDLFSVSAVTPAVNHFFNGNEEAEILTTKDSEQCYHLVAQLLFLSKRAQQDIQTAIAFLTTRVKQPNVDDWQKFGRAMKYLSAT